MPQLALPTCSCPLPLARMAPQTWLVAFVVLGVPASAAPEHSAMRGAAVQQNASTSSATPATATCTAAWGDCIASKCCPQGYVCYEKHNHYAQCQPAGQCFPGVHEGDELKTPWSCQILTATPASNSTVPQNLLTNATELSAQGRWRGCWDRTPRRCFHWVRIGGCWWGAAWDCRRSCGLCHR